MDDAFLVSELKTVEQAAKVVADLAERKRAVKVLHDPYQHK